MRYGWLLREALLYAADSYQFSERYLIPVKTGRVYDIIYKIAEQIRTPTVMSTL